MTDWPSVGVTAVLTLVGLYLANSVRRKTQAEIAAAVTEKRFDAYAALWEVTKTASPMREVIGEEALTTPEERRMIYDTLTDWYYEKGNGMLLSEETRNIYLTAKENLICAVEEIEPQSLGSRVGESPAPDVERGRASVRQFSLLRTAMRGDILIYTAPWGRGLGADDREFLAACGVDVGGKPWHRPPRLGRLARNESRPADQPRDRPSWEARARD